MKPSDFQKTIQCQFDCKLKRVVKGIVRNYRKELKRRRNKEISYCELPEIVVEKLAIWDEYESDYTAFDVCGIEVRVLDDDLAEAIKYLSEKDREILLMYFFLGMSDTEIGDRLKINRSTSFRSRKNSLEELKGNHQQRAFKSKCRSYAEIKGKGYFEDFPNAKTALYHKACFENAKNRNE